MAVTDHKRLTELVQLTAPTLDDVVYIVDDPASGKNSRYVTLANLISVWDHGSMSGLGDDDHTIYLLVDGTRAMSGDLSMGNNDITNGGDLYLNSIQEFATNARIQTTSGSNAGISLMPDNDQVTFGADDIQIDANGPAVVQNPDGPINLYGGTTGSPQYVNVVTGKFTVINPSDINDYLNVITGASDTYLAYVQNFGEISRITIGSTITFDPNSGEIILDYQADGLAKLTIRSERATATTAPARIDLVGHDAGGNDTGYAIIRAIIDDATAGSEDGSLDFLTSYAGTASTAALLSGGGDTFTELGLYSLRDGINERPSGLTFYGKNDGNSTTSYAAVQGGITDPTAGSEQGFLAFQVLSSGIFADKMTLSETALSVTPDADFASDVDVQGIPTSWLPFTIHTAGVPPWSADGAAYACTIGHAMILDRWVQAAYVATTNNGSHYWTIRLRKLDGTTDTIIKSFDTSAQSADTWFTNTETDSDTLVATEEVVYIQVVKTGSPGDLYLAGPLVRARPN